MSAPLLSDHLAAAEAALERGDALGAAAAVQAAVEVCARLQDAHPPLAPADLAGLQAQRDRLAERAEITRESLKSQLDALGRSRLARSAYGRR